VILSFFHHSHCRKEKYTSVYPILTPMIPSLGYPNFKTSSSLLQDVELFGAAQPCYHSGSDSCYTENDYLFSLPNPYPNDTKPRLPELQNIFVSSTRCRTFRSSLAMLSLWLGSILHIHSLIFSLHNPYPNDTMPRLPEFQNIFASFARCRTFRSSPAMSSFRLGRI